ncbi:uncharacterized protein LOC131220030 [Magnolia sinica]|uniref:uncharacterized protein LOC131220030 n=1 Tax=Magnolia sinica TaxID=86752 RepID=UPI00265950C7|nr:uncharacterized protein LOC131220030 [Magnolia sinica]
MKGTLLVNKKVSHHPMIVACHREGRGQKFWGDSNLKSKFWVRSNQLDPVGFLTLEFDDGEVFQWSKVTTFVFYQSPITKTWTVPFQEIIDMDDGIYEAVAGSDLIITRVAFRDNSSKHYINDRGSNFTKVTKKLKGKGVDLDNCNFSIIIIE